MGQADCGFEIATGRRQQDGRLRLSVFTHDLLALSVDAYSERAPTLLLTPSHQRQTSDKLFQRLV